MECLNSYDLVLWTDIDCIFTNFSIDISTALEDEFIGALNQEPNTRGYYCTGNLLIKSNDYTKNFFNSLKSYASWNSYQHPWEQTPFNEALIASKFKHLKEFKINEFGSFARDSWWCIRPWEKGDFILHLCMLPWQEHIDKIISYMDQIV